jgi:hypothetical protein
MLNSLETRSKKLKFQDEYEVAHTEVRKNTRRDKRKWVNGKANKGEAAVRKGDIKELYNITRKLTKRKYQGMQPLKNKDGALLTNDDQMKRWKEYFTEILNPTATEMIRTTSSPTDRCDNRAEKEEKERAMERPPNKDEIKKALKNTKNGKAPGLDNIPPKLLKEDIDLTANILCNLFEKFWEQEKIPKTGEIAFCSNYQRKEMFLTVKI